MIAILILVWIGTTQWDDMAEAKNIIALRDQNDRLRIQENTQEIQSLSDQICQLRAEKKYKELCNNKIKARMWSTTTATCPQRTGKAKYDPKQDTCLIDTDVDVIVQ